MWRDDSPKSLPAWLTYNSTTKALSGVPLAPDVGDFLIKVETKCARSLMENYSNPSRNLTHQHPNISAESVSIFICQEFSDVFQLSVVLLKFHEVLADGLSDNVPTNHLDPNSRSKVNYECGGDKLVASLVVCSERFPPQSRPRLLKQLADFLTLPVSTFSFELVTEAGGLRAVQQGFHLMSAGASLYLIVFEGSMEERSKSIFEIFELMPLSCRGGAKLYPQNDLCINIQN